MSIKDRNDSIAYGALMAGLRSATVLKYMVSVKEDISYPELITKICHHIQVEKTSDLEASKLSQDMLLGGKCKLDSQIDNSTTEGSENGNKNKIGNEKMEILTRLTGTRLLHVSANTPLLLFLLQQPIMRISTLESSTSLLI